ncbi:MAG TPA: hypothetical protein VJT84_00280 [Gaiellaceae bacterium]|nr:hypothetical protein [Gaiellaceae bacterium]
MLAERGVWPVVVCTEPFLGLAELTAESEGLPGLDLMIVPGLQPLGSRNRDELVEEGRAIAERLRRLAAEGHGD